MRVLIACEFSGVVREAFRARGHDAWSCDLLPTINPPTPSNRHMISDVRLVLRDGWDMLVAHPPCTFLCNAFRWAIASHAAESIAGRSLRQGAMDGATRSR